ncbi:MAG: nucleoside phosphorylase [Nanoarchaeota archaeon]|nr:nucleoside phosphorylase [Nanoarchaeota archaeon]
MVAKMRTQKGKPVITARKFLECSNRIRSVPESFVITSKNVAFNLLRFYNIRKAGHITYGYIFTLTNQGIKLGIACPESCGAPALAIIVEELVALGAKRFIFVGAAGALQPFLKVGSAVLPEKSVREEGTSSHYAKPAKYSVASEALNSVVEHSLRDNGVEYHKGTTWTTDAFYRETKEKVADYRKEGVLCVDMEASALFAVAEHHKTDATALLYITDSLTTLEWKPYFGSEAIEKSRLLLLKAAIDALCMSQNISFTIKPARQNIRGLVLAAVLGIVRRIKCLQKL